MRAHTSRLGLGISVAVVAFLLVPGAISSMAQAPRISPSVSRAGISAASHLSEGRPTLSGGPPINWFNVTQGTGPSPRQLASVTYDAADGYLLLFGGGIHRLTICYGDTWEYPGRELDPAPPRYIPTGADRGGDGLR